MIKKVVFRIEGMNCTSCAMLIDGDVEDVGGVKSCKTSYVKAKTEVEFDPVKVEEEEIVKIIGRSGYKCAVVED